MIRHLLDRIVAKVDPPSESSVLRGSAALGDQLVASATNFLTGIIIGRVCAQEEFGLYMLGFSIVQVATRIQGPLILSPYMVFSPRLKGGRRSSYLGSTLVHQIAVSLLCVLPLALGGVILSQGVGPEGLARVVWALTIAIAFILLREYARNVCFADLRFHAALVLDVTVAVLQISVLLVLALQGRLDARLTFWVIGFACGVAGISWLYRMRFLIAPEVKNVLPDLRQNWGFGKWIFASSLLYDVSIYAYPWILTVYHGVDAAGVWAACFGAVAITNPLIVGMVNHAGPEIVHSFAQGGIRSLRRIVSRVNVVFVLLLAPLALALVFLGDELVVLFYGQKYQGFGAVVTLLAVDVWLSPPRITLSRALFAMERADLDLLTNIASLIVLLTVGLWLVRVYGPVGVAGAVLVGNTAASLAKLATYLYITRSFRRSSGQ